MFRGLRAKRRTKDASRQEPDRPGDEGNAGSAPAPVGDPIEQITDLDELRGQGILTEEEFTAEKRRLLGI